MKLQVEGLELHENEAPSQLLSKGLYKFFIFFTEHLRAAVFCIFLCNFGFKKLAARKLLLITQSLNHWLIAVTISISLLIIVNILSMPSPVRSSALIEAILEDLSPQLTTTQLLLTFFKNFINWLVFPDFLLSVTMIKSLRILCWTLKYFDSFCHQVFKIFKMMSKWVLILVTNISS